MNPSETLEILSKKFNKGKTSGDYQDSSDEEKEKNYEYYEELFKKIFKGSAYYKNMSPQVRTIIEIFRQFSI